MPWSAGGGGTGSVTSVALTAPAIFTVGGSPVTTAGTLSLTLASQLQNLAFLSPNGASGAPTFRAIATADLPATVGTVQSVGVAVPAELLTVSGTPVTTSGTITLALAAHTANLVLASPNGSTGTPAYRNIVGADFNSQTANFFLASPNGSAGNPTFRAIVAADLPAGVPTAYVTKTANYTAVNGDRIQCDTSAGAFTITSPAAVAGNYFQVSDGSTSLTGVSFATNNLTVSFATGSILRQDGTLGTAVTIATNGFCGGFVYNGTYWKAVN